MMHSITRLNTRRLALTIIIVCAGLWFVGSATGHGTVPAIRLDDVASIEIHDDWTGFSPMAPIKAHYSLRRSGGGLKGRASFSIGGYSGHPRSAQAQISVPRSTAAKFVKLLVASPLTLGKYRPRLTVTDGYPSISITVKTKKTKEPTLVFHTESQGATHVPWGLRIGGEAYTITSPEPARALKMISPYLKHDVLERLMADAKKRNNQAIR